MDKATSTCSNVSQNDIKELVQASQGPKAPSDLEDISPKTTATTTSNQKPHDTAAVFSITPNENANLFFYFVHLFLFLLFVVKFLFYFVVIFNFLSVFVIFLQKMVKKCLCNKLVTGTEADVDQDPPETTAVSIASNGNDNHRMFIAGLSSDVKGIEQEKVSEQIQDTEPATPSPGEPTKKRNEQSQYHSSGKSGTEADLDQDPPDTTAGVGLDSQEEGSSQLSKDGKKINDDLHTSASSDFQDPCAGGVSKVSLKEPPQESDVSLKTLDSFSKVSSSITAFDQSLNSTPAARFCDLTNADHDIPPTTSSSHNHTSIEASTSEECVIKTPMDSENRSSSELLSSGSRFISEILKSPWLNLTKSAEGLTEKFDSASVTDTQQLTPSQTQSFAPKALAKVSSTTGHFCQRTEPMT